MNIHAIICDDDFAFAKKIETWLYDYHFSNFEGTITINVQSCSANFSDEELSSADIVFLDIDMMPVNGIQTARRIRKLQSTAIIIFITNYIEYSPDGYEVNAFRFILKSQWCQKLPIYYTEALATLSRREQKLKFKWGSELYQVKLCDVLYLESRKRTIYIHLVGQPHAEKYFYSSMNEMQEQLGDAGFLRAHKSFLINMIHIKTLSLKGIVLDDGTTLPISQRGYSTIRTTYINWKCNQ